MRLLKREAEWLLAQDVLARGGGLDAPLAADADVDCDRSRRVARVASRARRGVGRAARARSRIGLTQPDVAVDRFGASTPNWRNPVLRVGALVVVVFLVLVRFRARERTRIRAARGRTMSGLGQAKILALALSPERKNPDKPTYTPPSRRKGSALCARGGISR